MHKEEVINLPKTYIELSLKLKCHLSDFFMNYLSYYIGGKSTLNYHMNKSEKGRLMIPIYPYETAESHSSPTNLIQKKIEELHSTLENIDWSKAPRQFYWLINAITKLGFDNDNSLTYKVVSDSLPIQELFPHEESIHISIPKTSNVKVKKYVLKEGSILTTISDPYISDFGIYVDLSVPFDEMGMLSNGLHLYEHLSTKAWDNLSEKDCSMVNGTTIATGISYVYSVHKTFESFKEYLNAALNFIAQSRNRSFWDSEEMKTALHEETKRTISEMRQGRSKSLMARSDIHAYLNDYNVDIFHYWANRPFNILCVVRDDVNINNIIDKNKINNILKKYPISKVERPKNRKFKNIPVEVLITKMAQNYKMTKVNTVENIKHIFLKNIEKDTLYGIDCKISVKFDEKDPEANTNEQGVEDGNNNLCALLFYNKYVREELIEKYCNKNVLPYSNIENTSSMNSKFSSEYYT